MRNAKDVAKGLVGRNADTAHGYVTIARVGLESLSSTLKSESPNEETVSSLVKEIENSIQSGLEQFPDDEYLLSAESTLAELIQKEDRAVAALEKAFKTNSASPFVARSLSRLYEKLGKTQQAGEVLEKCLEILPGEKSVNAAFAQYLMTYHSNEGARIATHWRRSFTDGDTNYTSQFWFCRQLYVNGNSTESRAEFKKLRNASVSSEVKHQIRGVLVDPSGNAKSFTGTVETLESFYARFSIDGESFTIQLNRAQADSKLWPQLRRGQRVQFQIGFNFHGPAVASFVIL